MNKESKRYTSDSTMKRITPFDSGNSEIFGSLVLKGSLIWSFLGVLSRLYISHVTRLLFECCGASSTPMEKKILFFFSFLIQFVQNFPQY